MKKPQAVADNPLPEFIRLPNGDVEIRFGEFQTPVVIPAVQWVGAVTKVSKAPADAVWIHAAHIHGVI